MNRLGNSSKALAWMAILAQRDWHIYNGGNSLPFDGDLARFCEPIMWKKERSDSHPLVAHYGELDVLACIDPAGDCILFEYWDRHGRLVHEVTDITDEHRGN